MLCLRTGLALSLFFVGLSAQAEPSHSFSPDFSKKTKIVPVITPALEYEMTRDGREIPPSASAVENRLALAKFFDERPQLEKQFETYLKVMDSDPTVQQALRDSVAHFGRPPTLHLELKELNGKTLMRFYFQQGTLKGQKVHASPKSRVTESVVGKDLAEAVYSLEVKADEEQAARAKKLEEDIESKIKQQRLNEKIEKGYYNRIK